MNTPNPFNNIPSSSETSSLENVDNRTLSSLSALVERMEAAVARNEAIAKNEEELAGAVFETFLDDDGSMKDFSYSEEVKVLLHKNRLIVDKGLAQVGQLLKSVPTSVEAQLSEEDRALLERNFQSWKDLLRLYFPIVIGTVAVVVICLMGSIMLTVSASQKKADYEQRLQEFDRWHRDIVYRDTLVQAHSIKPSLLHPKKDSI